MKTTEHDFGKGGFRIVKSNPIFLPPDRKGQTDSEEHPRSPIGAKDGPVIHHEEFWSSSSLPVNACIPINATGQTISPVKDPYNVGDIITVFPTGLVGTDITFQWFVQGALRGTSSTLVYTLTSADFPDPTPGSISSFNIDLIMRNPCTPDFFQVSVDYNGQQDP